MGTQSPFGIIFIVAITIGALTFAVMMGYIYLPKLFKKSKVLALIGIFAIRNANSVVNNTIAE